MGALSQRRESENPDLFWALRGGGGNFGVVTSFLFRTHPVAMLYGGPIVFELSDAAAVMKWFRDNQPKAPDEFFMFLGLQVVPPGEPFPKEHWSKKMCALVVCTQRAARGGREGRQRGPGGSAETDHRLGPADALLSNSDAVRPAAAKGAAVVLEGRLRQGTARRRHRRASRSCGEVAERAFHHASLPDRRRRPSADEGFDRVGLSGRSLVDGDRRNRSRSGNGPSRSRNGRRPIGRPSIRSISREPTPTS